MTIFYFFPIIAAFIAWTAGRIAIKFFFKDNPENPSTLSGIILKNKPVLAHQAGTMVKSKIWTSDIGNKISDPSLMEGVKPALEEYVDHFIKVKLVEKFPVIGMLGGDKALEKIKESLMEELDTLFPKIIGKYAKELQEKIDIQQMVEKQVNALSVQDIHAFIERRTKQQILKIQSILTFLGFGIGLVLMVLALSFINNA